MAKAMFDGKAVGAVNLLDTAPIVPGSIVSKPLVQLDGCKVILFAMDAGQSISEHQAPFVLSVHVLDGRLDFAVAGERRTLAAGDFLMVPSDARHDLVAPEPVRFLLTMVRPAKV